MGQGDIVAMHKSVAAALFGALLIPAQAVAQSGYDAETFRRFLTA